MRVGYILFHDYATMPIHAAEVIEELDRRSRRFAESYHDATAVAKRLIEVYESL